MGKSAPKTLLINISHILRISFNLLFLHPFTTFAVRNSNRKMKKFAKDFIVRENSKLNGAYALLKLAPADGILPEIQAGQFVQVEVKNSKTTFLRRPISVNFADYANGLLWLLVRNAGDGTHAMIEMQVGEVVNIVLPLGHGFTAPSDKSKSVLLTGGGVGVAPLLFFGKTLKDADFNVSFLLGAKSEKDLLELDEFRKYGEVFITTEDGSLGERGFVTMHSVLKQRHFSKIACCGPTPMMKAVAKYAKANDIDCEVSLENVMACGLGACLCCVEDTVDGNLCVCKEGPVFNIKRLKWLI